VAPERSYRRVAFSCNTNDEPIHIYQAQRVFLAHMGNDGERDWLMASIRHVYGLFFCLLIGQSSQQAREKERPKLDLNLQPSTLKLPFWAGIWLGILRLSVL
jgi:hypothetical protein